MYKDARKTPFLTNFSEKISLNRFPFRKMTLKIGFIFIFCQKQCSTPSYMAERTKWHWKKRYQTVPAGYKINKYDRKE